MTAAVIAQSVRILRQSSLLAELYAWQAYLQGLHLKAAMYDRALDLEMFARCTNLSERIVSCYCEGFREEWVLGPHAENPQAFTVEMSSEHDVYALFLSMAHQLRSAS